MNQLQKALITILSKESQQEVVDTEYVGKKSYDLAHALINIALDETDISQSRLAAISLINQILTIPEPKSPKLKFC